VTLAGMVTTIGTEGITIKLIRVISVIRVIPAIKTTIGIGEAGFLF